MLINWDYEDGGDYLVKIFCKEFDMSAEEKVDYIYFSVIKLHLNKITYELMCHEDFGNVIYSVEQDEKIAIIQVLVYRKHLRGLKSEI